MSDLLPTGKAAKYVGVSKWTLRRWVAAGRIAPKLKKKNGYLAFDKADLDALIGKGGHKKYKKTVKKKDGVLKEPQLLPKPKETKEVHEAKEEPVTVVVQEEHRVLIVPPSTGEKPKKGIGGLFKRLFGSSKGLMIVLTFALSFSMFRGITVMREDYYDDHNATLGDVLSFQTTFPNVPTFSLLDAVMAAASSSGETSVQFLATNNETVTDLFAEAEATPPPAGNPAYTARISNYTAYSDSPYAYLQGTYGDPSPVAVIEKADTLSEQPFFTNVRDGDKLLIYKKANKALLFRPMTNSVIAFSVLDAAASQNAFIGGITGENSDAPMFLLRNGMTQDNDLQVFEAELRSAYPDAQVVDVEQAMRFDYKKSILIDATHGAKAKEARDIARKLRLTVSELPADEPYAPAGVDFIVIVGTDRK